MCVSSYLYHLASIFGLCCCCELKNRRRNHFLNTAMCCVSSTSTTIWTFKMCRVSPILFFASFWFGVVHSNADSDGFRVRVSVQWSTGAPIRPKKKTHTYNSVFGWGNLSTNRVSMQIVEVSHLYYALERDTRLVYFTVRKILGEG